MTTTIEQLKTEIDSTRAALSRVEGQQASAQDELAKLEIVREELGFDAGTDLQAEADSIIADVQIALAGVNKEVVSIVRRADPAG